MWTATQEPNPRQGGEKIALVTSVLPLSSSSAPGSKPSVYLLAEVVGTAWETGNPLELSVYLYIPT